MAVQGIQGFSKAIAISKSDTVNYDGTTYSATGPDALVADAIYVGGAGVVIAVFEDGETASFTAIAGAILPIRTIRVNSGSTTATVMVALFYA